MHDLLLSLSILWLKFNVSNCGCYDDGLSAIARPQPCPHQLATRKLGGGLSESHKELVQYPPFFPDSSMPLLILIMRAETSRMVALTQIPAEKQRPKPSYDQNYPQH